jgi:hypothetical protein
VEVVMSSALKDFHVTVDDSCKLGIFANAFRVIEEAGPDCFLDFLLYSAQEQTAQVVSRVRVRRVFLPAIRAIMEEFADGADEVDVEMAPELGQFAVLGDPEDGTPPN